MGNNSPQTDIWGQLGYYGLIYLLLIAVTVIGYPLAQTYAKPLVAFIFPISPNSLPKSVLVITGMYWATVGASLFLMQKPSGKK